MRKPKTHFEQVPIEIVKKIVEQQVEREELAVPPITTGKEKSGRKSPVGRHPLVYEVKVHDCSI
jgi:hypothetical protein